MAFTNQPQAVEMGVQSQSLPVSMQYLTGLDTIICKQKIEMAEVLTGFETRNKYGLYNKEGQQIFFVEEQSDAMERCYNPGGRGFNLQVTDNHRLEVMRFTRDFKWCLNCCCCAGGACQMVINVEHPPGKIIGRVKGADATCNHHVQLFDAVDNHKFTIWTTCCPCQDVCCPDDINIPITDPSLTTRVGNIAKQWKGCCREALTDADQFKLTLPADMAIDTKVLLLGALFFVEFLMFEKQQ